MKKIKVEEAIGQTLCHDITAMRDGFKGAAFRRGHVITEEDIPELLDIGKKTVFIWEDQADEIHEEDAALRMAAMAQVFGTHYTGPSEGKMQLMADIRGMFRVDTNLLKQLNAIDDITISCIPDHYPAEEGARLASMRIVPLTTREENIRKAEELCQNNRLFDLLPYQKRKVGVIITGSEVYSGRIKDKFEPVVRTKLQQYPSEILGVTICDDDLDMIVDSAQRYLEMGADFLIFTGGMSVDPDDLTPTAIRRLGADIISHGIPAQPGNMTLVAYLSSAVPGESRRETQERQDRVPLVAEEKNPSHDTVAILGVPGAAISLPATMFDVLLPQIFTGVPFTRQDLRNLGDGGLCQQCNLCHFPNCTFGRY